MYGITMERTAAHLHPAAAPGDIRLPARSSTPPRSRRRLPSHGFESVYPGVAWPLEQQIRLFASASHLAGPDGGGHGEHGVGPAGL